MSQHTSISMLRSNTDENEFRIISIAATIVIATIVSSFLVYYNRPTTSSSKSSSSSSPPLPPPPPPFGPTLREVVASIRNHDMARYQQEWHDNYGSVCLVKSPIPLSSTKTVLICDPAVTKDLCLTQVRSKRFVTRTQRMSRNIAQGEGNGITAMVGSEWKWRKEALVREFHKKRMLDPGRALTTAVENIATKLCDTLEEQVAISSYPVVEMDLLTTALSINVIIHFLFGRNLDFDAAILRDSGETMVEFVIYLLLHPFHHVFKHIPGSGAQQRQVAKDRAWKAIDAVTRPEVEMLLDEYNGIRPVHPDRKPGSALAVLIADEPRFRRDVESMIADVRIFVLAGFETTAHALAFAFGLLAEHPDIGTQIAKEAEAVAGLSFVDDTNEIIEKTPTAHGLFMEALRLYPLIPQLGGECLEDVTITTREGIKYRLDKGTNVTFSIIPMQRVGIGSDVQPEKWNALPADQPFLHTFNTGQHVCPGKPLSLLEAHIVLVMAASRFEFSFPNDSMNNRIELDYRSMVFSTPKDGMPLLVRERTRQSPIVATSSEVRGKD